MLFLFLRYFNFCSDFFGHVEKRLDEKANINFKISDVIGWKKNDYNAHTTQKLKKERESDNEIWIVNRI